MAAPEAGVFLTSPDIAASVGQTAKEMLDRAASHGRELRIGLRVHVIVRKSEERAREAASRLVSKLDAATGDAVRGKSLDAASLGVQGQVALRGGSDGEGCVAPRLWTGIGRARSGAGAAIVGDADQVVGTLEAYREAGVPPFILSGYPHIDQAEHFAEMVMPPSNTQRSGRPESAGGCHCSPGRDDLVGVEMLDTVGKGGVDLLDARADRRLGRDRPQAAEPVLEAGSCIIDGVALMLSRPPAAHPPQIVVPAPGARQGPACSRQVVELAPLGRLADHAFHGGLEPERLRHVQRVPFAPGVVGYAVA